jgi:hypothetical protein
MLAINTMLRDIYTNKSSDEYKMKGDITKSPSYSKIEEMIADLKTLKGYSKQDADDITKMFHTLHRPAFKAMVKEYIMEQNDKNTLFTATFTVGYRILVGELARIYASTEATDKGIVYKPDKLSRKSDASRMIKLYNEKLEQTLNSYVADMKKFNRESAVNESYLTMICDNLFVETDVIIPHDAKASFESLAREKAKDSVKVDDFFGSDKDEKNCVKPEKEEWAPDQSDKSTVEPVKEEADDTDAPESEGTDEPVQETVASGLTTVAAGLADATGKLASYGTSIGIIAMSVGIIAGLFKGVNAIFKGFNPIADINNLFMSSYEKKIKQLSSVSALYEETKRAYEDYMKNPDSMRSKKVENKYLKNMEKYNITMNNLAAQIEHYNERSKKESAEFVSSVEKKLPTNETKPDNGGNESKTDTGSDDEFQF